MGIARQLKWYGEVLPLKVAKFLSCLDSLDHVPVLKRAVLSSVLTPDCNKSYVKCPFCEHTYSRKMLWSHIYYTHYDRLLEVVDKYVKLKLNE